MYNVINKDFNGNLCLLSNDEKKEIQFFSKTYQNSTFLQTVDESVYYSLIHC